MAGFFARLFGKRDVPADVQPSGVADEIAALRRFGGTQSGSFNDSELEGEVNRSTILRFAYVDRDGVAGLRQVTDWVDTRFYVKGHCADRRALRTFRKDQIEQWISGQQALRHGQLPFGRSRF